MISLIEALNFRCLRYIRQPLDRFHLLVGPNASGKTTFLDVVSFLSDFVRDGLDAAIEKRSLGRNFVDLLFGRTGRSCELAIEVNAPQHLVSDIGGNVVPFVIRFEVGVGLDAQSNELGVLKEVAYLLPKSSASSNTQTDHSSFESKTRPVSLLAHRRGKAAFTRAGDGKATYFVPREDGNGRREVLSFRLPKLKSALSSVPDDDKQFPIELWLQSFLFDHVQLVLMDGQTLRRPSAANQRLAFLPDCSNLPWVVNEFRRTDPARFSDWVKHLREALPDLQDVDTIQRPEDLHRYLVLVYEGGLRVPSWTASDGTLRLLALTLTAFLPSMSGVILVEEPENGIHPRAIETMMQAVSNVYDAQVLVATHSPVVLGMAEPEQVLCFSKDEQGATDIVRGDRHPALVDWKREVSLSDYFVAGVLG